MLPHIVSTGAQQERYTGPVVFLASTSSPSFGSKGWGDERAAVGALEATVGDTTILANLMCNVFFVRRIHLEKIDLALLIFYPLRVAKCAHFM
jgi:hypothetical protein